MEEGGGEMRFRLPAAPSPGPPMFLLSACREVARAGGHTTGAVAVQLLEWDLGNAVLEAFRCNGPLPMVMHVQQCCLLLGVWIKAFSQQFGLTLYGQPWSKSPAKHGMSPFTHLLCSSKLHPEPPFVHADRFLVALTHL